MFSEYNCSINQSNIHKSLANEISLLTINMYDEQIAIFHDILNLIKRNMKADFKLLRYDTTKNSLFIYSSKNTKKEVDSDADDSENLNNNISNNSYQFSLDLNLESYVEIKLVSYNEDNLIKGSVYSCSIAEGIKNIKDYLFIIDSMFFEAVYDINKYTNTTEGYELILKFSKNINVCDINNNEINNMNNDINNYIRVMLISKDEDKLVYYKKQAYEFILNEDNDNTNNNMLRDVFSLCEKDKKTLDTYESDNKNNKSIINNDNNENNNIIENNTITLTNNESYDSCLIDENTKINLEDLEGILTTKNNEKNTNEIKNISSSFEYPEDFLYKKSNVLIYKFDVIKHFFKNLLLNYRDNNTVYLKIELKRSFYEERFYFCYYNDYSYTTLINERYISLGFNNDLINFMEKIKNKEVNFNNKFFVTAYEIYLGSYQEFIKNIRGLLSYSNMHLKYYYSFYLYLDYILICSKSYKEINEDCIIPLYSVHYCFQNKKFCNEE